MHFGDGWKASGFGSTAIFAVAGVFLQAKIDGAQGGLLANKYEKSKLLSSARACTQVPVTSLNISHAKPSGMALSPWIWGQEKTLHFAEQSSPLLSSCFPWLHPPDHLGTSKPLHPVGLTLTDAAGTAKLVPDAHVALECLCVPSHQPVGHHPKLGGNQPSLGQKRPGPRPPCSSFGARGTAELPFSGATPKRDLPKRFPVELAQFAFPHYPLTPLCSSQPYLSGHLTASPGTPGSVAIPVGQTPPELLGRPGGGSHVRKQFPHAKELVPSRHALLKPHQPSY